MLLLFNIKSRFFLVVIITFIFIQCSAQNNRQYAQQWNVWMSYTGTHKIANKWSLHLEAQWRRHDGIKQAQQLLLRSGVNYHFNNTLMLTAGYCFVETYPYGAFPVKTAFPEHRLWQQLQIKSQYKKIEWICRNRLEQRFNFLPVLNPTTQSYEPGAAVYTNRVRLLNRVSIPLKGKSITTGHLYLSVFDELFINFGKNVSLNVFDQNRIFGGIGYHIPKVGRMECGYMMQQLIKPDGIKIENNHTLVISLLPNINFYQSKR